MGWNQLRAEYHSAITAGEVRSRWPAEALSSSVVAGPPGESQRLQLVQLGEPCIAAMDNGSAGSGRSAGRAGSANAGHRSMPQRRSFIAARDDGSALEARLEARGQASLEPQPQSQPAQSQPAEAAVPLSAPAAESKDFHLKLLKILS